jgi:hypothetical protein
MGTSGPFGIRLGHVVSGSVDGGLNGRPRIQPQTLNAAFIEKDS